MTFDAKQVAALEAPLNAKHVKARSQAGRSMSYVEGWWAISEANRIFGFGGWNRETITLEQLGDPREVDGKFRVAYLAKVRITVGEVAREGCGYGSGIDRDLGSAHESALKEAETDAMKRALMTFGNPFGLALYDKEQNGVEHDAPKSDAPKTIASDINEATIKARKWADDAIADIRKMTPKLLSEWEIKNSPYVVKLKDIDPDKHKKLVAAMQECDGLLAAE